MEIKKELTPRQEAARVARVYGKVVVRRQLRNTGVEVHNLLNLDAIDQIKKEWKDWDAELKDVGLEVIRVKKHRYLKFTKYNLACIFPLIAEDLYFFLSSYVDQIPRCLERISKLPVEVCELNGRKFSGVPLEELIGCIPNAGYFYNATSEMFFLSEEADEKSLFSPIGKKVHITIAGARRLFEKSDNVDSNYIEEIRTRILEGETEILNK